MKEMPDLSELAGREIQELIASQTSRAVFWLRFLSFVAVAGFSTLAILLIFFEMGRIKYH
ncbi:hypothetical protein ACWIEX_00200 [Bosea sp. NPDC055353]